jgi:hypothetical protein
MKIMRFEEIKAWQEARKLVKLVYDTKAINKLINPTNPVLRNSSRFAART